jgi:thioredoxin 1
MILAAAAGILGALIQVTQSRNATCGIAAPKGAEVSKRTKGNTAMSNATAVTAADFDTEVLHSDQPVLVDFWAPWCMPCRMLAPTIDQLAAEYTGKAKVVKVNTDENQDLAGKYGIRGIPTLILFKNGEPVDRVVGVQSKPALADRLDKVVTK